MKTYLKIFGVPGFLAGSLIALSNYYEKPSYHWDMRTSTGKRLDRFYMMISLVKGFIYGIIYPYTYIKYIYSIINDDYSWRRKLLTPLSNSAVIIDENILHGNDKNGAKQYISRKYVSYANNIYLFSEYHQRHPVNNKFSFLERYLFDFYLQNEGIIFYLYQPSKN